MYDIDWTNLDQFKQNIMQLKKTHQFISLTEAYDKLQHDKLRIKNYAVLTADDGWKSVNSVLPWLAEQEIPITLFVNPAYLSEEETRENGMGGLLTWEELKQLLKSYPNVSIASHGWNHKIIQELSIEEFSEGVQRSHQFLKQSKSYIPFYAYPCGFYRKKSDAVLQENGMIPVYIDRMWNRHFDGAIHRESIDGLKI